MMNITVYFIMAQYNKTITDKTGYECIGELFKLVTPLSNNKLEESEEK